MICTHSSFSERLDLEPCPGASYWTLLISTCGPRGSAPLAAAGRAAAPTSAAADRAAAARRRAVKVCEAVMGAPLGYWRAMATGSCRRPAVRAPGLLAGHRIACRLKCSATSRNRRALPINDIVVIVACSAHVL